MLNKIIELSVKNRFIILLFTFILIAWGIFALLHIPLDAIPDLSDTQVIIYSEWMGQSPQEIEDQVTYPLTSAMLSVPKVKVVRGYSFFGFSLVYVIFEDGTDIYWARSRVLEYLNYVTGKLPQGVTTNLGPDATGVGWVFQYTVEGDGYDLATLRAIQDWYIRYQLLSVEGVSEVASIGGFVKQYQIELDPDKLLAYNIPLKKVIMAVKRSNRQVGGRLLEMTETEYMVRGLGYVESLDDIKNISVGVDKNGTPILIKDIADVHLGPDIRRGIAERDGKGEVVGGIVVMRFGENALKVIENVKKKIKEIEPGLPKGVKIIPNYDRSKLIHRAIDTLKEKILEECLIVALVCLLFLWHFRSALVAILTLPLGIFISFIIMFYQGINANIMSLGGIAIAIGAMIDAAVVMVENAHKRIEHEGDKKSRWEIIIESSKQVGPALFFSLLIITVSFLPVFTLQAQEGRLFSPLAFTKTYAMAGAALLSITLVPIMMGLFIRGRIIPEAKNPINRLLLFTYKPIVHLVLRYKKTTVFVAMLIVLATIYPLKKLGYEFMPPLNEGDILYMPTTLPGISITEAKRILQTTDKIFRTFPEVDIVFGKIGRADTPTDPAPLTMIETTVILKDKKYWRSGMTIEKLMEEMDKNMQIPGLTNAWTMPIKTRIDMLSTGIKTPVGIKVFGSDLKVIEELAIKIEHVVKKVPGCLSVYAERVMGGNYLDFEIDRTEIARYGLTIGDVQDVIATAIGGMNITSTVEGRARFPINVRYSRELRDNIEALKRVLIPTPTGAQIPLGQLAEFKIKKGPAGIKSENAMLCGIVYVDIRGRDVGSFVEEAKDVVAKEIKFPPGYYISWSGQYEYMERANRRLKVIVPITLLIIFLLLYFNFRNIHEPLIIMLSLPFAVVGGVWLMYLFGFNMSIAVGVGFIALAGVAAEIGVIMLIYLDAAYKRKLEEKGRMTIPKLYEAVIEGAALRIRPIMMTVLCIIGGLLPLFWGEGTGSRVMMRIATPMVGGMVSATILTLIVIPAIYALIKGIKINTENTRKNNHTNNISTLKNEKLKKISGQPQGS